MNVDELGKVEEFLKLVETLPEETFIRQNQAIHRRLWLDTVKKDIREMKVSMGGKEKWSYLRRV